MIKVHLLPEENFSYILQNHSVGRNGFLMDFKRVPEPSTKSPENTYSTHIFTIFYNTTYSRRLICLLINCQIMILLFLVTVNRFIDVDRHSCITIYPNQIGSLLTVEPANNLWTIVWIFSTRRNLNDRLTLHLFTIITAMKLLSIRSLICHWKTKIFYYKSLWKVCNVKENDSARSERNKKRQIVYLMCESLYLNKIGASINTAIQKNNKHL